jgi:STE24 endopeptidase
MTAPFWFITRLKSFAIMLPFISAVGALFLAAIKRFKIYSLFIVPAGGLIIGLFMIIIYPIAILPIFYDIKSIENPVLEKKILELAGKAEIEIDSIYVIRTSDYSKHTNAFFVGFGSHKKIYLYDTLLSSNSDPEIISILAHEIGHWVYNHNLKGIMLGFILYLSVFAAIYFCAAKYLIESKGSTEGMHNLSMIPVYLLFFIIFGNITNPIEMIVSRKMETNADIYSLNITNDPDTFISSNIKLAKDNSSRLNPNKIAAFFRRSHPTTIERIKIGERYK